MKKLFLPLIIGVLGGIASASAATIVTAKKSAVVYARRVSDSVAKHVSDSTVTADSVAKELKVREAEQAAAEVPLTPADSIREAQSFPTTLRNATKGLPNAADMTHGAAPATHSAATAGSNQATTTPVAKGGAIPSGQSAIPRAVTPPRASSGQAPDVVENGLGENRIAKIFGAMQSKEAAKVLEQMTDSDIRVILGKMGDKQAAAILVALPAARAAAISKGESVKPDVKKPEGHKPEAKPEAHKPDTSKSDSGKVKKDSSGMRK